MSQFPYWFMVLFILLGYGRLHAVVTEIKNETITGSRLVQVNNSVSIVNVTVEAGGEFRVRSNGSISIDSNTKFKTGSIVSYGPFIGPASANTPELTNISPVDIIPGSTVSLDAYISANDLDEGSSNIQIVIVELPESGTLERGGQVLNVGDVFWANELNQINFVHNVSSQLSTDDIILGVTDSTGLYEEATFVINVDIDEFWENAVGADVNGGSFISTAGGWGNAAANSKYAFSGNGSLSFTAIQDDKYYMIGLAERRIDSGSYQDINFAIYIYPGGFKIYEGGTYRGDMGAYNIDDTFEVVREGNQVIYKRNNNPFYTSTLIIDSSTPLMAAVASSSAGSEINDARFVDVLPTSLVPSVEIYDFKALAINSTDLSLSWSGSESLTGATVTLQYGDGNFETEIDLSAYDSEYTLPGLASGVEYQFRLFVQTTLDSVPYSGYSNVAKATLGALVESDVIWENVVGASVDNNIFVNTNATSGWGNSAANADQSFGGSGRLVFSVSKLNRMYMVGLAQVPLPQNTYQDIDYAIYLAYPKVLIYEKGAYRGSFGYYFLGDQFEVVRNGSTITYLRNNEVFYTSSVAAPASTPLMAAVAANSVGSEVADARYVNISTEPIQELSWGNAVGATLSDDDNTFESTVSDWGNSAANSKLSFEGDGSFGFTILSNSYKYIIGLGAERLDENNAYQDIDYALAVSYGSFQIYEKGTYIGDYGSFVTGDYIEFNRSGDTISIQKNGVTFYTSATTVSNSTPLMGIIVSKDIGSRISYAHFSGVEQQDLHPSAQISDFLAVNATQGSTVELTWSESDVLNSAIVTVDYGIGNFDNSIPSTGSGMLVPDLIAGTEYQFQLSIDVLIDGVNFNYTSNASQITPENNTGFVSWENSIGADVNGSSFVSTTGGWGNAAANSRYAFSGNGSLAFTAVQDDMHYMIGLADRRLDSGAYRDIMFAIYLYPGGVKVYETGNYRGNMGTYNIGDTFEVVREGNQIIYKRNNNPFYTSTWSVDGNTPLMAAVTSNTAGSEINDARFLDVLPTSLVPAVEIYDFKALAINSTDLQLSWSESESLAGATVTLQYGEGNFDTEVDLSAYDSVYTLPGLDSEVDYQFRLYIQTTLDSVPYDGYSNVATATLGPLVESDVVWENVVGADVENNIFTGTASGFGNSAANATESFEGDGGFAFTVTKLGLLYVVGLSDGPLPNNSREDIDYGIYLAYPNILIYENGVYRTNLGYYYLGDQLEVVRQGTTVSYLKNNEVIYTSSVSVPTSTPLVVAVASASVGSEVADARYRNISTEFFHEIGWENAVGADLSNNDTTFTSTASTGWGNSAANSKYAFSGDGGLTFSESALDDRYMIGLSQIRVAGNHYFSIDYAIYISDDRYLIYENGISRNIDEQFNAGDQFEVVRNGNQIAYLRNGVEIYSSLISISNETPLMASVSAYGLGSAVEGARFEGLEAAALEPAVEIYDLKAFSVDASDVEINWTESESLAGATITLQYGIGNFDTTKTVSGENAGVRLNGLVAGQLYQFRLHIQTTIDSEPYSEYSNTAYATPDSMPPFYVTWENVEGADVIGNVFDSTASDGWGNSSANSVESFEGDGRLVFTGTDFSSLYMLGLAQATLVNSAYQDIDYAIYIANHRILIYENGTSRGSYGIFQPGDQIEIKREGNQISYLRNNVELYASTVSILNATPLMAAVSSHSSSTELSDVRFMGVVSNSPQISSTPMLIQSGDQFLLSDYISISDVEDAASDLLVELTQVPLNGDLVHNSLVLNVGDTFTANELNLIDYIHDDSSPSYVDYFEFSVTDQNGLQTLGLFNVYLDLESKINPPFRFIKILVDGPSSASQTEIKEVQFFQNNLEKMPLRTIDSNFLTDQSGLLTMDQDASSSVWSKSNAELPAEIIYDFAGDKINPSYLVFRANLSTTVPTSIKIFGSNDNASYSLIKDFSNFAITNDDEEQTIHLRELQPLLSGRSQSDSLRPTWYWYSNGGQGIFRYKLDDSDLSSELETGVTTFQSSSDLSEAVHILYVEEKLWDGSWSQTASFSTLIDASTTLQDRSAPTAPDLQVIVDLGDYQSLSTNDLEIKLDEAVNVAARALSQNEIESLIDNLYLITNDLSSLGLSATAIDDLLETYANLIEESLTKSMPVLSENLVEKVVLGLDKTLVYALGSEASELQLLSVIDEIALMGERSVYQYGKSNTIETLKQITSALLESWRQEFHAGSSRDFEFLGSKMTLTLESFLNKDSLDRHVYSNALLRYQFPPDLSHDDKITTSSILPFKANEFQSSEIAPFFVTVSLLDPADGSEVSLGSLVEPIQLTLNSSFASDKTITALEINASNGINVSASEAAHLYDGQLQLLITDLATSYTLRSERDLAIQAPQNIIDFILEAGTSTDITRAISYLAGHDPLDYTLTASEAEYLADGTANATVNGQDIELNVTMVTESLGRVYLKIFTQEQSESNPQLEYVIAFDVVGNNAPTTENVTLVIDEDQEHEFELTDITFDDADGVDTVTHVVISTLPTSGSLVHRVDSTDTPVVLNQTYTLSEFQDFWYLPLQDQSGPASDSIAYQVQDQEGSFSNSSLITVDINAINDAPVIADKTYQATEDQVFAKNAAEGVLEGASDADADSFTAHLVSDVSEGDLTLNTDGSFTYTPSPNFNGTDSFTFWAYDNTDYSLVRTVTLEVENVPDNPVAQPDSYFADKTNGLTVGVLDGVLENDSDADPTDTLTAVKVTDPQYGTLTLNPDGSFIYIHTADREGLDTFTYKVLDNDLNESSPVTVEIDVQDLIYTGTVTGSDVEGVIVTLEATDQSHTLVAHTDENGDYEIGNVQVGVEYNLNVKRTFLDLTNADTTFTFDINTPSGSHVATYNENKDVDGDGILDKHELNTYETNPYESTSDQDGDTIPDPYDPAPQVAAIGLPSIITVTSPSSGSISSTPTVELSFEVSLQDGTSVIDEVRVNSEWITNQTGSFTPTITLPEGEQDIVLRVRTVEGHLTVVRWPITINALPPELEFISPVDQDVLTENNIFVKIWSDTANLPIADIESQSIVGVGHYYTKWINIPGDGSTTISAYLSDGAQSSNDLINVTMQLDPGLPADEDFDSDTVVNQFDLFPKDQLESVDNDGDGVGSFSDPDDSNAQIKSAISITSHLNGELIHAK